MAKLVLQDKDWKAWRKKVVTATEASTILGLNPWNSGQKMYENKLKPNFVENSYVFIGQLLEPIVCKLASFVLDKEFELYETDNGKPFYILDGHRLGATPDAVERNGDEALLECKTTKPYNLIRWSDSPPKYYIVQLLVQMMCVGKEVGYLAIMGTNLTQKTEELELPFTVFKVERHKAFEMLLLGELERFWNVVESDKKFRVDSKAKKLAQLIVPTLYRRVI